MKFRNWLLLVLVLPRLAVATLVWSGTYNVSADEGQWWMTA